MMKFSLNVQTRSHVKCRGEPLGDILWQGSQWAVTTYGLECRDGTYAIKAGNHFSQFGEVYRKSRKYDPDSVFLGWFQQLSGKSWCDADDVDGALEAMFVLYDQHGKRTNVPAPFLLDDATIEEKAVEAADRAYRETKDRLINGLLL